MKIRKCRLLVLLLLIFPFATSAFAALTDGLVAYYPFSGNADDASGNGNHGVVNGATPASDRFGQADSAYSFDGATAYIRVPAAASLEIQDAITLSAWVYHLSNSSPQHIVNMSALYSGYRLAAWWANPAGNALELYDVDQVQHIADDGRQPVVGTWTHVAATWDGSVMRVYRDGVPGGSTPFAGTIGVAGNDLYIGVLNPIPWPVFGYFHGYIDEVRVYNRALSPSEVAQLMAMPVSIDIAPNSKAGAINPGRGGDLPVAILTGGAFDALQVDPASVVFGPGEATASRVRVKDTDRDGDADLLLYFGMSATGIACSDTNATLFGATYDGTAIAGQDSFTTRGCR